MDNKKRSLTFASLALALANDYSSLYVIESEDDSYVEYTTSGTEKELVQVSSGENFFEDVPRNCRELVWKDDQDYFLSAFQKEDMINALENGRSFSLTYRLNIEGSPRYYFLKIIRADDSSIIIGVRDIDDQKRKELSKDAASRTYAEIAESLASLFEVIYHINVNTGSYTEYSSSDNYSELGLHRSGNNFFKQMIFDVKKYIHPDDCDRVIHNLDRDVLLKNIRNSGSVSLTYRQELDGTLKYVNLLAFRQKDDAEHIVIGVRNIDTQTRHEQFMEAQNRRFGNIAMALAQQYEVIYHVNTVTNEYSEYSASEKYSRLEYGAKGKDFFAESHENMKKDIYPDDRPKMLISMQKENLLKSLSSSGKIILNYRLLIDGVPQYVSLYAVRPKDDPEHIIVAVANVDAAKRMELAYYNALDMANRDALTGVKNKRAYVQTETDLDVRIQSSDRPTFAIVVCDVNNLKHVNDTQGHKAGDEFIKKASSIICDIFKRSPVFRIGGDEFAVLLKERDYVNRHILMKHFRETLNENLYREMPILACGISDFDSEKDMRVQDVFERADALMYSDKKKQKAAINKTE